MEKQITKKQHWYPKFYIEDWKNDNFINYYDIKNNINKKFNFNRTWKNKDPFYIDFLYENDDYDKPNYLENLFCELETNASKIIRKIKNNDEFHLSVLEITDFVFFFFLLGMRTNAHFNVWESSERTIKKEELLFNTTSSPLIFTKKQCLNQIKELLEFWKENRNKEFKIFKKNFKEKINKLIKFKNNSIKNNKIINEKVFFDPTLDRYKNIYDNIFNYKLIFKKGNSFLVGESPTLFQTINFTPRKSEQYMKTFSNLAKITIISSNRCVFFLKNLNNNEKNELFNIRKKSIFKQNNLINNKEFLKILFKNNSWNKNINKTNLNWNNNFTFKLNLMDNSLTEIINNNIIHFANDLILFKDYDFFQKSIEIYQSTIDSKNNYSKINL